MSSSALAKESFMHLFFVLILIVSFKLESFQGMVINDLEYAKEHHGCLIVDNFICASTSRTEKHLVTFRNECFFNSAVKVNEAVAMVYCGICDPNREFQKKGAKPDPKDFECLKFDRKGKNGQQ